MAVCEVCFRHCDIGEGKLGVCKARTCRDGKVVAANYGRVTSLALDPIEKKPLARFFPGSQILSYGSYGCNLFCPFCQNHDISRSDGREFDDVITPEDLLRIALKYRSRGNIGIAYTYNEPLVSYEFIRDTARLVNEAGMKNVLVTNGTAEIHVLEEILPYIDAMNVDIKSMSEKTYRDFLKGDLATTKAFIERAAKDCHIELTMLIVPGMNDTEDEMRDLISWIAGLTDKNGIVIGNEIPLHISRFFPRYRLTDVAPTDVSKIYALADVAREKLKYVYTGNC
ncbi:MAG: AmmeMemoRadiSam system radical SAM enzyme [Ruminococcaceae bacterium]|nr:AmmeMemoRadiSam system radical SAM enzyme [Oscillospiraceae bacterium]